MSINILKITVLSISLATVTSAAAIAPALGLFVKHFWDYPEFVVKLIISVPSAAIIVSSMFFGRMSKLFDAKKLAFIGFCLFIIGGVVPFFLNNLYVILMFRAILGFGVGFLTPLSVSLIGFLFDKKEQAKLMGLSGMCNQIGAVATISFSGFLASISWNYSFLIYLFAVFIFILNMIFLPKITISQKDSKFDKRNFKIVFDFIFSMFVVQVLFYSFTNNFSIIYQREGLIKPSLIGVIMGLSGVCGAIGSFMLSSIMLKLRAKIKYLGGILYIIAFSLFAIRLNHEYFVFGVNIMLIFGILGAMLNGFATGVAMPLFISQISLKSKKINLATNMAIGSMILYAGQFLSPFIDWIFESIFSLTHQRDVFLISSFIALFLLIYSVRIKIKLTKN